MNVKCAFLIGLSLAVFMGLSLPSYAAMSITNPYIFTINRGPSGNVFGAEGYFILLGVYVQSSSGTESTVTAQQVVGGSNTTNVPYLNGTEYSRRLDYDANLIGQWQIAATNGQDGALTMTSTLDDVRLLPLAQSLSVSTSSGLLTPTLSWTGFSSEQYPAFSGTHVNGSDDFDLRVRIRRASTGAAVWTSPRLSTGLTNYTIPSSILSSGQNYLLEIMLDHYDYESGNWYLENRSETFLHYYLTYLGDIDQDNDIDGSDLAALIANSGLLDVTTFAENFGRSSGQ